MQIYTKKPSITMRELSIKRVLDLVFAIVILLLVLPIMLLTALLIWLDDGLPIFFIQARVGRKNTTFYLYKFRSMQQGTPNVPTEDLGTLSINPITRVGSFIRRTGLDELPQLLNIIQGEMSFVGPRPALAIQYELLELRKISGADQCLPGLTGLAQVHGLDNLNVPRKAKWDAVYARSHTLWLDAQIIVATFAAVLQRILK